MNAISVDFISSFLFVVDDTDDDDDYNDKNGNGKKKQTKNRNRNPKLNINQDKNIDIQLDVDVDNFEKGCRDDVMNASDELTELTEQPSNRSERIS